MNSFNIFLIVYLIILEVYLDKKKKGFLAIDKSKSSVDSQTLNRIGLLDAEKRKGLNVIKGGEEIKKTTLKPPLDLFKNPLISSKTNSVPSKSSSVTSKTVSVSSKTDPITSKTSTAPSKTLTTPSKNPGAPSKTAQVPSLTPAVRPSMSALSEEQRKRIQENVRLKKAEKEAKFKAKEEKAKKEKEKERLKRKFQEELKSKEIEEMLKKAEEKKETERKREKEKKVEKEKENSRKKQELKHESRKNLNKGEPVGKSGKSTTNIDKRREKEDSENEKLRRIADKLNKQDLLMPEEPDKGNGSNEQKSLTKKSHAEILKDLRKEKTKVEEETKRLLTNKSENKSHNEMEENSSNHRTLNSTQDNSVCTSSLDVRHKPKSLKSLIEPETNTFPESSKLHIQEASTKTVKEPNENPNLDTRNKPNPEPSMKQSSVQSVLEHIMKPELEPSAKPVPPSEKKPNLDTRTKPILELIKKPELKDYITPVPEPIKKPDLRDGITPVPETSRKPILLSNAKSAPESSKKPETSIKSIPEPTKEPEPAKKLHPAPVTKQTVAVADSVSNSKRKRLESTERESKLQKLQSSKVEVATLSNLDRLRNILNRDSSDSEDSDSEDSDSDTLSTTKNYSSTDKANLSSHEAHIAKKPRISSELSNSSCQPLDKKLDKLNASKSNVDDPTVGDVDPIHENIQVDHEFPDSEPLPIEIISVRSLSRDSQRLSMFMETFPNPAYTIYHPKPGEIIELNDDGSSGDEMEDMGDKIPYR